MSSETTVAVLVGLAIAVVLFISVFGLLAVRNEKRERKLRFPNGIPRVEVYSFQASGLWEIDDEGNRVLETDDGGKIIFKQGD